MSIPYLRVKPTYLLAAFGTFTWFFIFYQKKKKKPLSTYPTSVYTLIKGHTENLRRTEIPCLPRPRTTKTWRWPQQGQRKYWIKCLRHYFNADWNNAYGNPVKRVTWVRAFNSSLSPNFWLGATQQLLHQAQVEGWWHGKVIWGVPGS